jgi:hypothetical protein
MSLDPTMKAALLGVHARMFGAIEIVLPGHTARLLDGAGTVSFGGRTFTGLDPAIGTIGSLRAFTDGIDQEAPSFSLSILPSGSSAITALMSPAAQGGSVTAWVGVIDPLTGLVIGSPDVRFVGQLDVATRKIRQGGDEIELAIISAFEHFFDGDEGVRLNDAWHQSIWPGETGLQAINYVQRQLPWGSDAPRPAAVTDVFRTAGGGAGSTGGGVNTNTGIYTSVN